MSLKQTISDIFAMSDRNLLHYFRLPQLIVFSSIQPVMFVLLFAYVFGGAIKIPGLDYIQFLLPGIFVQTVIFGSMNTGIGLAQDMSHGMIDRFRSLPMARSAVLAGRTLSDILRNVFVILLMVGVGYLIGFRFEKGIPLAVGAMALCLFMGFAFSWIAAWIGLMVKDTETAQVAGFIWIFPLIFASSLFVPIETMPNWLEAFAKVNPVTVTVNAVRAMSLGGQIQEPLLQTLGWIVVILIVFVPLAINRYRKTV